eukprot:1855285-Prymnesium_polylepis.1
MHDTPPTRCTPPTLRAHKAACAPAADTHSHAARCPPRALLSGVGRRTAARHTAPTPGGPSCAPHYTRMHGAHTEDSCHAVSVTKARATRGKRVCVQQGLATHAEA